MNSPAFFWNVLGRWSTTTETNAPDLSGDSVRVRSPPARMLCAMVPLGGAPSRTTGAPRPPSHATRSAPRMYSVALGANEVGGATGVWGSRAAKRTRENITVYVHLTSALRTPWAMAARGGVMGECDIWHTSRDPVPIRGALVWRVFSPSFDSKLGIRNLKLLAVKQRTIAAWDRRRRGASGEVVVSKTPVFAICGRRFRRGSPQNGNDCWAPYPGHLRSPSPRPDVSTRRRTSLHRPPAQHSRLATQRVPAQACLPCLQAGASMGGELGHQRAGGFQDLKYARGRQRGRGCLAADYVPRTPTSGPRPTLAARERSRIIAHAAPLGRIERIRDSRRHIGLRIAVLPWIPGSIPSVKGWNHNALACDTMTDLVCARHGGVFMVLIYLSGELMGEGRVKRLKEASLLTPALTILEPLWDTYPLRPPGRRSGCTIELVEGRVRKKCVETCTGNREGHGVRRALVPIRQGATGLVSRPAAVAACWCPRRFVDSILELVFRGRIVSGSGLEIRGYRSEDIEAQRSEVQSVERSQCYLGPDNILPLEISSDIFALCLPVAPKLHPLAVPALSLSRWGRPSATVPKISQNSLDTRRVPTAVSAAVRALVKQYSHQVEKLELHLPSNDLKQTKAPFGRNQLFLPEHGCMLTADALPLIEVLATEQGLPPNLRNLTIRGSGSQRAHYQGMVNALVARRASL
ncbi:hypothetical protein DFH07DRAFT_768988 [Mycena maculata]|uniref:Uncharacterized protein n=1 Tax=Mycena maculata TaxID=230809 RepID=A0AAD7NNN0_9AGAR|nr:hypothetical protein DFH07DRAFT_768988 [Mycena maculata]